MSDLLDKAEFAEKVISERIQGDFSLKRARFYAVNETDEGVALVLASEHGDIYELIDSDEQFLGVVGFHDI